MKSALVCGAGGFIGHHLVKRLKSEGYWVRGVDLKYPKYEDTKADEFIIRDLRERKPWDMLIYKNDFYKTEIGSNGHVVDEIYQLAADMGGAGFVFTGENDADIMHNSAQINLNCLDAIHLLRIKPKVFYSSSACVYPDYRQKEARAVFLSEEQAYPADPDSEYGWEKLFSERIFLAYHRNYFVDVKIARFHNIFGPLGSWNNGREKSPAALCRKVAMVAEGKDDKIEIWGDGRQVRTFLYIDECIDGIRRLMNSKRHAPINIGSDEAVSINKFLNMIVAFEDRLNRQSLNVKYVDGPVGVMGRASNNREIKEALDWQPTQKLEVGLKKTYEWVLSQIREGKNDSD
jgi:GDP-D-mannose 3', 5'-epimerase